MVNVYAKTYSCTGARGSVHCVEQTPSRDYRCRLAYSKWPLAHLLILDCNTSAEGPDLRGVFTLPSP